MIKTYCLRFMPEGQPVYYMGKISIFEGDRRIWSMLAPSKRLNEADARADAELMKTELEQERG